MERGATAVPYFLMKYTADTVQVAPLADWDEFFTDNKKVAKLFFFVCDFMIVVKRKCFSFIHLHRFMADLSLQLGFSSDTNTHTHTLWYY